MSQLSSDDIGQVESLANSNRELSKNDFIFHIKVMSINFFHVDIFYAFQSYCFKYLFCCCRIQTCLSSLIVLTQNVIIIGMKRFIPSQN